MLNGRLLLRDSRGATYLFLMLLIVIMGLSITVAATQWKTVVQREREADLLAYGMEIRQALGAYSASMKKARVMPNEIYPLTLNELTRPPKPFLRKAYKDPLTGEDWEYLRDAIGGIKGVRSKNVAKTIKRRNFPPELEQFEGTQRYREWTFVAAATALPPPELGQAPGGSTQQPGSPQGSVRESKP